MVSQTRLRVIKSDSCKRPSLSSKRAKQKFWSQQVLFGTKFLKFGPKRANLATLVLIRAHFWENVTHSSVKRIRDFCDPNPLQYFHCVRDGTRQHFCCPARPEVTRNHSARTVYAQPQIIFQPWPARGHNIT